MEGNRSKALTNWLTVYLNIQNSHTSM